MTGRAIPSQLVQSLNRAIDILEMLVETDDNLGVSEIGSSLGLHKSTVYRLLATLSYRGYVDQNEKTGKYTTGMKLFEIGSRVLNNMDLRSRVRPFLEEIMKRTKETVHLGIIDDNEIIYIDKVESPETIRMYSRIGARVPLHSTSLGKVILAFMPETLVDRVVEEKGLTAHTANTITDPKELKKELEIIKARGYAVDNEEQDIGIRCIAAPIFDYNHESIAAFSISGPSIRMTVERTDSLAELILSYSRRISAIFGYNE